jgi:hypothetical protein
MDPPETQVSKRTLQKFRTFFFTTSKNKKKEEKKRKREGFDYSS